MHSDSLTFKSSVLDQGACMSGKLASHCEIAQLFKIAAQVHLLVGFPAKGILRENMNRLYTHCDCT